MVCLALAAGLLLPAVPTFAAPPTASPAPWAHHARNSASLSRDVSGVVFYRNPPIDNALIRIWKLLASNDFKRALVLSDQTLAISPRCGQALLFKGYCLYRCEQPSKGVDCMKRALALLPEAGKGVRVTPECGPDWTYHILSAAQMECGQLQDALATIDKGLQLYKTSGFLYLKRADIERDCKHYDAAVADASMAIKLGFNDAYVDRAKAYLDLKKGELAIADLNKAMTFKPEQIELYTLRGEAYKLCGKLDLAKKDRDTAYKMGLDGY